MNVTFSITCKVVKYDQLPKKRKEELLQKCYDGAEECYRADHIEEAFAERLAEIGFMEAEFSWQVSSAKIRAIGDGACFDAKPDMEKLCKHLGIKYNPDWEGSGVILVRNHNSVHAHSRRFECECECDETVQDRIEELRKALCDELFEKLVADLEAATSKEHLLETLRSCKYVALDAVGEAIAKAAGCEICLI